ncbi:MAG: NAD(P)/FAD-dependent oxidoreductase [Bacteroidota bacterium]
MSKTDYDAIVVGSGPNGLAAAITMQQNGLSVLLIEGSETIGGGLRSSELTLPGFIHDECSAVHPMAVASPFFETLPLAEHGLQFIYPTVHAAHPFDDGSSASVVTDIDATASSLGEDENAYRKLIGPLVNDWPLIDKNVLGPLTIPRRPIEMAMFGLNALRSARSLSKKFSTQKAKGLWAGMAAHSIMPLSEPATSAIGLVLLLNAHRKGWPIPKGGSQSIANALASIFTSLGGKIQMGEYVKSVSQLPSARAILFDVTPKQLIEIAGHRFSFIYRWQLEKYKYGMGVFKIDWALHNQIPFTSKDARLAGTLHLGNTFGEIEESEYMAGNNKHSNRPFVLLAQPSVFDATRAPAGKHTAWAYCHVPNGSVVDMTEVIEKQVERFAPGFRETIISRSTRNTKQMQEKNPNYIGGDINGGSINIDQLFTRPALRLSPYRTSAKGIYICSASTPPGGGVHGMGGYHAAKRAMKDLFKIN